MEARRAPISSVRSRDLRAKANECSSRGWSWITDQLQSFVPADLNCPDALKAVAELALTYSIVARRANPSWNAVAPLVGKFLRNFFDDATIAHHARKSPALYNPYLMAYLPLRGLGLRLQHYEEAICYIGRAGYPFALELIPYRELELQYISQKAFGLRGRRQLIRLASGTVLWKCSNPAYMTVGEVYSVTHTLLYVTDFGSILLPLTFPNRRKYLAIAETLLIDFWRRRNWDIVGELLLGLVGLGASRSRLFKECTSEMLNAWQPDGFLPGPRLTAGTEGAFEDNYHTTLVGLLFCSGYASA